MCLTCLYFMSVGRGGGGAGPCEKVVAINARVHDHEEEIATTDARSRAMRRF
jgi:hypothetical protein